MRIHPIAIALAVLLLATSPVDALPAYASLGGGTGFADITFRTASGATALCSFTITGELVDSLRQPRLAYAVGAGVGGDNAACLNGGNFQRVRIVDGPFMRAGDTIYFGGTMPTAGGTVRYTVVVTPYLAFTALDEYWVQCAGGLCSTVLHVQGQLFGPGAKVGST